MRYAGLALLVLGIAVAGCGRSPRAAATAGTGAGATAIVEQPKPPAALPSLGTNVPPDLAAIVVERNQRHKRQTGALLTITARWGEVPGGPRGIHVDWSIDYAGPRKPFAIAKPGKGSDPVIGHFWASRPDGTVAAFTAVLGGGRSEGKQPHTQRDQFSVSEGGKPVTGRLDVVGRGLRATLEREREPGPDDPRLWMQLEFVAIERGDGFDWPVDPVTKSASQGPAWTVDAWTGKLWSPVVEIAAK